MPASRRGWNRYVSREFYQRRPAPRPPVANDSYEGSRVVVGWDWSPSNYRPRRLYRKWRLPLQLQWPPNSYEKENNREEECCPSCLSRHDDADGRLALICPECCL